MKKVLTGFAVVFVAALWMTGSWFFFNSIANGAQGQTTPPAASVDNAGQTGGPAGHGHYCNRHWKDHHWHHYFWEKLDLTKAQKEKIHTIIAQERPKIKPLLQQLRAGHEQLRELRKSGPFNEKKVRAIAQGQANTLVNLIVERERVKSQIYAVLTPQQRAKAEKIRESWKARHFKHWEEHHHKD